MRTYPRNSPEAAARIVAVVLIADGHVCRSEFDALDRLDAAAQLGLDPGAFPQIVQTLCEDLLISADASGSLLSSVDELALAALMAEVDEPALQGKVLRLAAAAAQADRHLSEGETLVLQTARRQWGIADHAESADILSVQAQA